MHPEHLESFPDIRRHARGALVAAGVEDVSFIPLDRVATAVQLQQADLFDLGSDAPSALKSAVKKLSSKLLGMLSVKKKTIYVDPDQVSTQKRFTTAHEIGHFVLPWQESAFHVDDKDTLAPTTQEIFEREANAFAGELMFGAGRFNEHADSDAPGIETPLALATEYGASAAATLRQYVERSGNRMALLAVSLYETKTANGSFLKLFPNQCMISDAFARRYGRLDDLLPTGRLTSSHPLFHILVGLTGGVGEQSELTLQTSRGTTTFLADSFCNGRLRYVLLFRRNRLSGRQRELVGVDGRPLKH